MTQTRNYTLTQLHNHKVYGALRTLGAPASLSATGADVIGYRNPFCGIFVKGALEGTAVIGLDKVPIFFASPLNEAFVSPALTPSARMNTRLTIPPVQHAQSKTIIRLSAALSLDSAAGDSAGGVQLTDVKDSRTLVTDILGRPKAKAKVGGKLVFEGAVNLKLTALLGCMLTL